MDGSSLINTMHPLPLAGYPKLLELHYLLSLPIALVSLQLAM